MPEGDLARAVGESGRVVVVEEGTEGFNWGSEVAAMLSERLHGKLLVPIRRLASRSSIIPASETGECEALVQKDDIENAIMELLE